MFIGKLLLGMNVDEIKAAIAPFNIHPSRATKIYDAIYRKHAKTIYDINTIPLEVRAKMVKEGFIVGRNIQYNKEVSQDLTQKILVQLHDGKVVETVGIPATINGKKELTACVSS